MRRASSMIVGRDQRGNALVANEVDQLAENVLGRMRIEVSGRLVGKQELRPVGEAAADGGALLFAA